MKADYDVIVVGCGPAGLSAGLYAGRARLKTLLLGNESAGGPVRGYKLVENYPGFLDGISGSKLSLEMMKQVMKYGLEFKLAEVERIELKEDYKLIKAKIIRGDEVTYLTKVVIIAGGAQPKKLGLSGEDKFIGKGVSYCGVCDAPQFTERVVAIVGGGNAAVSEALHLSKFASRVILIHRRNQLRATRILQEKASAERKIEFIWNTVVEEIKGKDSVEKIELRHVTTRQKSTLNVGGILIRIGLKPRTGYLKGILSLDSEGQVLVNEKMETSVPGIFAAGDIRHGSAKQIATAVGDGVTAALSAENLITLKY